MVCSERFLERSRQHCSVNHLQVARHLVRSTPCKGHVLVVQRRQTRFLEIKLLFLNRNLGHQRALRGRLLSNWARVVQLIFDGNLDGPCSGPVPLMLGTFSDSGQRCFVDVFGFMHLCVLLPNYGWGRDLHLQIEFPWLKVGGFRWQGSGTMDLCSCFWEVWPAADNVDHSKDHVTLSSQILEESIGRSATPPQK